MGLSPYYRGSSCNFWALFDRRPTYVGATVHLLSKGIDTGDILFHCLPQYILDNPFLFTMRSVEVAHVALAKRIQSGDIHRIDPVKQDPSKELRYSRNSDFDDSSSQFLMMISDWSTKVPESPGYKPWFIERLSPPTLRSYIQPPNRRHIHYFL